MSLPDLTVAILTYKRPWYAMLTLGALIQKLGYGGVKRYVVSDGGSPQEQLDAYAQVLAETGAKWEILVNDNMAQMVNGVAAVAGDLWFVTVDDFMPCRKVDITPDVRFILESEDVGMIRMGRLAFWEHGPDEQIWARLRHLGGLHWWVFDKERTDHPYICALNTSLYHRRFWDFYGDIPDEDVPPDMPGNAETEGVRRYNAMPEGPTVAVPMRFGEDCGDWQEPIWHFGMYRTDEYAAAGGRRM